MTDSEYLQLLERSTSFKTLSEADQESIRKAVGEERTSFVKVFQEEAEMIAEAYGKLADQTEKIVVDLKRDGQKNKKAKLINAEISQHTNEMNSAENLLKNL